VLWRLLWLLPGLDQAQLKRLRHDCIAPAEVLREVQVDTCIFAGQFVGQERPGAEGSVTIAALRGTGAAVICDLLCEHQVCAVSPIAADLDCAGLHVDEISAAVIRLLVSTVDTIRQSSTYSHTGIPRTTLFIRVHLIADRHAGAQGVEVTRAWIRSAILVIGTGWQVQRSACRNLKLIAMAYP